MGAVQRCTRRTLICSSGFIARGPRCCSGPSADPQQTQAIPREAQAPFVGKIWIATDPSAAPGTFRIFLPDGTLVMDLCRNLPARALESDRRPPNRMAGGHRAD